jgi:hypothetical protein
MGGTNLWGDVLDKLQPVRTPANLLREQAQVLGEKTANILTGQVFTTATDKNNVFRYISSKNRSFERIMYEELCPETNRDNPIFVHRFDLVAPVLNHYGITLFTVVQGVNSYPLYVLPASLDQPMRCGDEPEFAKTVSGILTSESVRGIVTALLSQSQEGDPLPEGERFAV